MVLAHNLMAMNAQRQFNIVGSAKKKSTEKLSSGYRINRAADDAAGLAISEKMRKKIRGLSQGIENSQDGISMCQIADGALTEVHDMLHRLTELSIKSSNGTNSATDREAIQEEVNQILMEIDRISENTEFNTIKLFDQGDKRIWSVDQPGESGFNKKTWYAGVCEVSAIGTPIDYSESIYNFSVDKNIGIAINDTLYKWKDIISEEGASISELKEGTYNIYHNGCTFSLKLLNNSTIEDIEKSMDGVRAITNEAHEGMTWKNINEFNFLLDYNVSWTSDLDNITHTLNISDKNISVDNNPIFSYVINDTDWNDIIGTSNGMGKPTYSSYEVQLSIILADGGKFPVAAGGQDASMIDKKPFNLKFEIENPTKNDFIRSVDGTGMSFYIDEELAYGARWNLSIVGKHEITQSNGKISVEGPFPTKYEEKFLDDEAVNRIRESNNKQIWIQSGDDVYDGMFLYFGEMNTNVLGIIDLDVLNIDRATEGIDKIEKALSYVSKTRSRVGAQQNRLEHTILNEKNIVENTQAAESRIRDTDMATEMVEFTKSNILEQAVTSMLAQANQSTQGVMSLLQ